jgi:hypothetical protein
MFETDIRHDVYTTAIEGGIQYWAQVVQYRHSVEEWFAGILDLGRLDANDQEVAVAENDWVRVDGYVIEEGMKVLAGETDLYRQEHRIHPRSEHAKLSFALATVVASGFTMFGDFEDMLDASTADMIVQAGLFGEVIYG